jgi:hypothetical protein
MYTINAAKAHFGHFLLKIMYVMQDNRPAPSDVHKIVYNLQDINPEYKEEFWRAVIVSRRKRPAEAAGRM